MSAWISQALYRDRYYQADAVHQWALRLGGVSSLSGRSDPEAVLAALPGWAQMYVEGLWSLEKFEAVADKAIAWAFQDRERPPP